MDSISYASYYEDNFRRRRNHRAMLLSLLNLKNDNDELFWLQALLNQEMISKFRDPKHRVFNLILGLPSAIAHLAALHSLKVPARVDLLKSAFEKVTMLSSTYRSSFIVSEHFHIFWGGGCFAFCWELDAINYIPSVKRVPP